MSPLTNCDIPCPNLSFDGKKAVCSIYSNRPERCRKEEMGGAAICPVGMSTLKLTPADALEYWRELEREDDIKACNDFLKEA
jgi:Fe-S-cluster containining protein